MYGDPPQSYIAEQYYNNSNIVEDSREGLLYNSPYSPIGREEDNIVITRDYYKTSVNPDTYLPDWVSYTLKPEYIAYTSASRDWMGDYTLSEELRITPEDYTNLGKLGYDRGHLAPVGNFTAVDFESTNILTNIVPQPSILNRFGGGWQQLENYEDEVRDTYGEVHSIAGVYYGAKKEYISLPNSDKKIARPEGYYKVLITDDFAQIFAFSRDYGIKDYRGAIITKDQLESLTGYSFDNIPDHLLERGLDKSKTLPDYTDITKFTFGRAIAPTFMGPSYFYNKALQKAHLTKIGFSPKANLYDYDSKRVGVYSALYHSTHKGKETRFGAWLADHLDTELLTNSLGSDINVYALSHGWGRIYKEESGVLSSIAGLFGRALDNSLMTYIQAPLNSLHGKAGGYADLLASYQDPSIVKDGNQGVVESLLFNTTLFAQTTAKALGMYFTVNLTLQHVFDVVGENILENSLASIVNDREPTSIQTNWYRQIVRKREQVSSLIVGGEEGFRQSIIDEVQEVVRDLDASSLSKGVNITTDKGYTIHVLNKDKTLKINLKNNADVPNRAYLFDINNSFSALSISQTFRQMGLTNFETVSSLVFQNLFNRYVPGSDGSIQFATRLENFRNVLAERLALTVTVPYYKGDADGNGARFLTDAITTNKSQTGAMLVTYNQNSYGLGRRREVSKALDNLLDAIPLFFWKKLDGNAKPGEFISMKLISFEEITNFYEVLVKGIPTGHENNILTHGINRFFNSIQAMGTEFRDFLRGKESDASKLGEINKHLRGVRDGIITDIRNRHKGISNIELERQTIDALGKFHQFAREEQLLNIASAATAYNESTKLKHSGLSYVLLGQQIEDSPLDSSITGLFKKKLVGGLGGPLVFIAIAAKLADSLLRSNEVSAVSRLGSTLFLGIQTENTYFTPFINPYPSVFGRAALTTLWGSIAIGTGMLASRSLGNWEKHDYLHKAFKDYVNSKGEVALGIESVVRGHIQRTIDFNPNASKESINTLETLRNSLDDLNKLPDNATKVQTFNDVLDNLASLDNGKHKFGIYAARKKNIVGGVVTLAVLYAPDMIALGMNLLTNILNGDLTGKTVVNENAELIYKMNKVKEDIKTQLELGDITPENLLTLNLMGLLSQQLESHKTPSKGLVKTIVTQAPNVMFQLFTGVSIRKRYASDPGGIVTHTFGLQSAPILGGNVIFTNPIGLDMNLGRLTLMTHEDNNLLNYSQTLYDATASTVLLTQAAGFFLRFADPETRIYNDMGTLAYKSIKLATAVPEFGLRLSTTALTSSGKILYHGLGAKSRWTRGAASLGVGLMTALVSSVLATWTNAKENNNEEVRVEQMLGMPHIAYGSVAMGGAFITGEILKQLNKSAKINSVLKSSMNFVGNKNIARVISNLGASRIAAVSILVLGAMAVNYVSASSYGGVLRGNDSLRDRIGTATIATMMGLSGLAGALWATTGTGRLVSDPVSMFDELILSTKGGMQYYKDNFSGLTGAGRSLNFSNPLTVLGVKVRGVVNRFMLDLPNRYRMDFLRGIGSEESLKNVDKGFKNLIKDTATKSDFDAVMKDLFAPTRTYLEQMRILGEGADGSRVSVGSLGGEKDYIKVIRKGLVEAVQNSDGYTKWLGSSIGGSKFVNGKRLTVAAATLHIGTVMVTAAVDAMEKATNGKLGWTAFYTHTDNSPGIKKWFGDAVRLVTGRDVQLIDIDPERGIVSPTVFSGYRNWNAFAVQKNKGLRLINLREQNEWQDLISPVVIDPTDMFINSPVGLGVTSRGSEYGLLSRGYLQFQAVNIDVSSAMYSLTPKYMFKNMEGTINTNALLGLYLENYDKNRQDGLAPRVNLSQLFHQLFNMSQALPARTFRNKLQSSEYLTDGAREVLLADRLTALVVQARMEEVERLKWQPLSSIESYLTTPTAMNRALGFDPNLKGLAAFFGQEYGNILDDMYKKGEGGELLEQLNLHLSNAFTKFRSITNMTVLRPVPSKNGMEATKGVANSSYITNTRHLSADAMEQRQTNSVLNNVQSFFGSLFGQIMGWITAALSVITAGVYAASAVDKIWLQPALSTWYGKYASSPNLVTKMFGSIGGKKTKVINIELLKINNDQSKYIFTLQPELLRHKHPYNFVLSVSPDSVSSTEILGRAHSTLSEIVMANKTMDEAVGMSFTAAVDTFKKNLGNNSNVQGFKNSIIAGIRDALTSEKTTLPDGTIVTPDSYLRRVHSSLKQLGNNMEYEDYAKGLLFDIFENREGMNTWNPLNWVGDNRRRAQMYDNISQALRANPNANAAEMVETIADNIYETLIGREFTINDEGTIHFGRFRDDSLSLTDKNTGVIIKNLFLKEITGLFTRVQRLYGLEAASSDLVERVDTITVNSNLNSNTIKSTPAPLSNAGPSPVLGSKQVDLGEIGQEIAQEVGWQKLASSGFTEVENAKQLKYNVIKNKWGKIGTAAGYAWTGYNVFGDMMDVTRVLHSTDNLVDAVRIQDEIGGKAAANELIKSYMMVGFNAIYSHVGGLLIKGAFALNPITGGLAIAAVMAAYILGATNEGLVSNIDKYVNKLTRPLSNAIWQVSKRLPPSVVKAAGYLAMFGSAAFLLTQSLGTAMTSKALMYTMGIGAAVGLGSELIGGQSASLWLEDNVPLLGQMYQDYGHDVVRNLGYDIERGRQSVSKGGGNLLAGSIKGVLESHADSQLGFLNDPTGRAILQSTYRGYISNSKERMGIQDTGLRASELLGGISTSINIDPLLALTMQVKSKAAVSVLSKSILLSELQKSKNYKQFIDTVLDNMVSGVYADYLYGQVSSSLSSSTQPTDIDEDTMILGLAVYQGSNKPILKTDVKKGEVVKPVAAKGFNKMKTYTEKLFIIDNNSKPTIEDKIVATYQNSTNTVVLDEQPSELDRLLTAALGVLPFNAEKEMRDKLILSTVV